MNSLFVSTSVDVRNGSRRPSKEHHFDASRTPLTMEDLYGGGQPKRPTSPRRRACASFRGQRNSVIKGERRDDTSHKSRDYYRSPAVREQAGRRPNTRPSRRSSARSVYTESSDNSVSFSSTKLGKLLNQEGFKFEKDFEVESMSTDFASPADQTFLSPRTAMHRRHVHTSRMAGLMANEQFKLNRDSGNGKITPPTEVRSVRVVNVPPPSPRLSETKIGKLLAQNGLKVDEENETTRPQTGFALAPDRRTSPRSDTYCHSSFSSSYSGSPPSLSWSDSSPSVNSQLSNAPSERPLVDQPSKPSENEIEDKVREIKGGAHLSRIPNTAASPNSLPSPNNMSPEMNSELSPSRANEGDKGEIVERPFVPINERVSVEELKAKIKAKAAKKQEIVNKIKSMDAKLSAMLTACHEASRKLKMMDEVVSVDTDVSSDSDVSELSLP